MPYPLPFPETDKAIHLLVVDDQEFDCAMICTRLEEVVPPGTTISAASSGSEALRLLTDNTKPIDCVLLDMNLGDIEGIVLIKKMLDYRPETSIVMITVEADMKKAILCLKAGAEDFLIKGEYSNMGLYRTVRYAMERRRNTMQMLRLNEELQHERALSAHQKEFIDLVTHEFRTPIAIISGATQLLIGKAPELAAGSGASQFRKIQTAISRLTGLLDNVIRLNKLEEGKEAFTPVALDMCELLSQIAELFEGDRIDFIDLPSRAPYHGDRQLLEYAIYNVLGNALKYSPADTKVTARLTIEAKGIEIIIADKGPGMSAEMIARAGEKFYRDSATSHIEGTGLGLHLVKRFMEYHNGTLKFSSTIGQGTTATLWFPHAQAAA